MGRMGLLVFLLSAVGGWANALPEDLLSAPAGVAFDAQGRLLVADTGHHRLLVFAGDRLVREVGKEGSELGQFREPHGITVDASGRVLVADAGNHRIQVFDADFRPLFAFGEQGQGNGQFNRPWGLTTDPQGHIIVADTWNHRLQFFDSGGKWLKTFGSRGTQREQFSEPGGVLWVSKEGLKLKVGETAAGKAEGYLLVANGWNSRIDVYAYDPDTLALRHLGKERGQLWGFWVCDDVGVLPDGTVVGLNTNGGGLILFDAEGKEARRIGAETVAGPFRTPRALAVGPKGEVAIADTGHDRVVVFNPDLQFPPQPQITVTRTRAVITWKTRAPAVSEVHFWPRRRETKAVGESLPPGDTKRIVRLPVPPRTQHRVELPLLNPATEYRFRVCTPSLLILPYGRFSMEYAFATRPPRGTTALWRLPVMVIIYPDVINRDHVPEDAPEPPEVPQERIWYYFEECRKAQLFFWVNSGLTLWVDLDFQVITQRREEGKDVPPERRPNRDRDLELYWQATGKKRTDYVGIVEIKAERRWNAHRKEYYYQGSGGGTYGLQYPSPGLSFFLGGSDLAWLFTHEFHHQVDSYYGQSGHEEYLFNHFSPTINTAFHFGEHYDGNAWILRHWPREAYFFCKYGELVTAVDADEDGVPDNDPRLPLDEARFGSDPTRRDTDGDGLTDGEEIMASSWVWEMLPAVSNVHAAYLRPDPRNPDTDGDGLRDGEDPYPLYAASPTLPLGTPNLDGILQPEEWPLWYTVHTPEGNEVARLHLLWDPLHLYLGLQLAESVSEVQIQIDADNDGWYVGQDGYWLPLRFAAGEVTKGDFWINNCTTDRWPFPDRTLVSPETLTVVGKRVDHQQQVEIALPRHQDTGLALDPGEELGLTVNFRLGANTDHWISAFEPYFLFDVTLGQAPEGVTVTAQVDDAAVTPGQNFTVQATALTSGETSPPTLRATPYGPPLTVEPQGPPQTEGNCTRQTFRVAVPPEADLGEAALLMEAETEAGVALAVARVRLVPPVEASVALEGSELITSHTGAERQVALTLHNHVRGPVKGQVTWNVPPGWQVTPAKQEFSLAGEDAEVELPFALSLPPVAPLGEETLTAQITAGVEPETTVALTFRRPYDWLIIGPFDNTDWRGFATVYPPEQEIDLAKTYRADEREVKWQTVPPEALLKPGGVDFEQVFRPNTWVTAYALTHVYAPEALEAELRLGSDDTLKVWHNGKEIIARDVRRGAAPNQDRVKVQLQEGWNRFLVKVTQGEGGWRFYFELVGPDGQPLPGLRSRSKPAD